MRSFHSRRSVSTFPPRVQLQLESLETRLCPAAPVLTLGVTQLSDHLVEVYGTAKDESPQNMKVQIVGVVTGTVAPDANGKFHLVAQATGLGSIVAWGVDDEGLYSDKVETTLTSAAPAIKLEIIYGSGRTVILKGKVVDESPGGLTVTFRGAVTGSIVTDDDGAFEFKAQATHLGKIAATTVDPWGLVSADALVVVESTPPIIVNFSAVEDVDGIWIFRGSVTDESAEGLIVNFDGLKSLVGKTAKVRADGTFSLAVRLQPGEEGTVSAITTDWWGLDSEVVFTIVHPT